MLTHDYDIKHIEQVVDLYFKGTYYGDAGKLKRAFRPAAKITGMLNGQLYEWTLSDFIARVTVTPTAATKKEIYNKEILSIDKTNNAAMVKARVAVGDLTFTDYITLLKINDQWIISNKSFTN